MARIRPYFETKYLVSPSQTFDLLKLLAAFSHADQHGEAGIYEVLSLYYDTHDLQFFNDKINGEYCKTKVRLRFYRNKLNQEWHDACLEIKQRTGHLVSKYRVKLDQNFSSDLCFAGKGFAIKDKILQTIKNSQVLCGLAGKALVPAVMVFYKRQALQFNGIEGLRFTFDSDIAGIGPAMPVFSQDFEFASHSTAQRSSNVFEIKSYSAAPASILSQLEKREIQQQSYSKFASSLQHLLDRTNDKKLRI